MNQQKISIQLSDDPLDTKEVIVNLPSGVKLLSKQPYALDLLSIYSSYDTIDENTILLERNKKMITQGIITHISYDNDKKISAVFDVDSKYTATCNLLNEPKYITSQLKEGLKLDIEITLNKKNEATASISNAISTVLFNELYSSINDNTVAFEGKVIELIHGGYWIDINGVTCFMPGSLGGMNKLYDFELLLNKTMLFIPIGYSEEKNSIIVSHREYLETLVPGELEKLRTNSSKESLEGFVTGTTKFGIFVEFNNCLTGLIPSDNLDEETLNKFNNREIAAGDTINFWIFDIISNKKIILTQKGYTDNGWNSVRERFVEGNVYTGKVTRLANYGVFVELEKGIIGLIHRSKLSDLKLEKGESVNVKIQQINSVEKRINLIPSF